MFKLISVKIDEELDKWKKNTGLSWRYIIARGKTHMDVCIPRQEFMDENFQQALNYKNVSKLKHWLGEKYPKIYNEFVQEVGWQR